VYPFGKLASYIRYEDTDSHQSTLTSPQYPAKTLDLQLTYSLVAESLARVDKVICEATFVTELKKAPSVKEGGRSARDWNHERSTWAVEASDLSDRRLWRT
jgi:hypothetical protein